MYRLAGGLATALTNTEVTSVAKDGSPQHRNGLPRALRQVPVCGRQLQRAGLEAPAPRPGLVYPVQVRPRGPGTVPARRERQLVRDYNLEQPGEVLLEGNVEYRFPLYSFINGAFFTDFGNVWTLRSNPQRPGAQFQVNDFYRQFAVGSGFGFRFDFTFLILRLDVATKVYDPTAPGSKWAIRKFSFREDQTAFNLGIGYPF